MKHLLQLVTRTRQRETRDRNLELITDLLSRLWVLSRGEDPGEGLTEHVALLKGRDRVLVVDLNLDVVHNWFTRTSDSLLVIEPEPLVWMILPDSAPVSDVTLELVVGDIVDPGADGLG